MLADLRELTPYYCRIVEVPRLRASHEENRTGEDPSKPRGGATDASLALVSNLWLAAGAVALGGAANMLFIVPSITLVQQVTPDEFRGRVSGLRTTLFCLAGLASNALVGLATERFGMQTAWAITGVLLALLGLLSFLLPCVRDADPR
jgi:MFS family permease